MQTHLNQEYSVPMMTMRNAHVHGSTPLTELDVLTHKPGPTGVKVLAALEEATCKAGYDASKIHVSTWYRQDPYADVSGLLLCGPDNDRLERWARAWVERTQKGHKSCNDWNSWYQLAVVQVDAFGVWIMTGSYSIGD